MSEIAFLVVGIFLTVTWTCFTLEPKQLVEVQAKCELNKGVKEIKVDITEYRISCTDGATFKVDR